MIVLALDPATSTGWACSDGRSGETSFEKHARGCTRTEGHKRVGVEFACWLHGLLCDTDAVIVYIESTPTSRYPKQISDGLRMLALMTCADLERVPVEVAPTQWQPWARKTIGWVKQKGRGGDENDAKAMLAWALATQRVEVA